MVFPFRVIALAALLGAAPSLAHRVVILELNHDSGGRLRAQLEAVVRRAGAVSLVSLSRYKAVAARGHLKGPVAFTGVAVARLSRRLRLDAAVGGELGRTSVRLVIYDPHGQQLWTKELPLEEGRLSPELASRLANAIAAAAAEGADPATGAEDQALDEGEPEPESGAESEADAGTPADPSSAAAERPIESRPPLPSSPGAVPGPPTVQGWLGGTTTWRSQCLRPQVRRCSQYDTAAVKPAGIIVDYAPTTPYLGVAVEAGWFPLAHLTARPLHRFLNGLGLWGGFGVGHAVTGVVEKTSQGSGAVKHVNSVELSWSLAVAYRVHFALGFGAPQPVGYVGLRAGVSAVSFTLDPSVTTSLPSSQRLSPLGFGFPAFGVEAAIPVVPSFGVDLGATLLVDPRPAIAQILAYGDPADPAGGVTSTGFSFEGGFSGHLWGPLGWQLHLRYTQFLDQFSGQGQKWPSCGDTCLGVSEERYVQLLWGVRAAF